MKTQPINLGVALGILLIFNVIVLPTFGRYYLLGFLVMNVTAILFYMLIMRYFMRKPKV